MYSSAYWLAAKRHQLGVRSLLDDAVPVQDIGRFACRTLASRCAMSNTLRCCACPGYRREQGVLGVRVQGCGGLVHDQQLG